MPIAKRGDSWQVTVCHDGKIHRRSSRNWTKAQASEVEAKLRKDLFDLSMGREPARTFNDAIERWTREELPRVKPRTRVEYVQNAKHIAPILEGRHLRDAADVAGEIRGKWPDLSPSTVNRRLSVVSRLVQLAKEWGWTESAPTIRMLPETTRETFLTQDQVEDIAKLCPRAGPLVLLDAYTGIRIGHLLRLTAADVVDGKFLRLDSSGKTGQMQLIPLHKRVRGYASRLPIQGVTYPVFYAEFKAACKALGIKARPHDLRHSFASWMFRAGSDSFSVQKALGHSSPNVTRRYVHEGAHDLAAQVNRIKTAHRLHKRKSPRKAQKRKTPAKAGA